MSSLDRFASELVGALLGKSPGSDNFNFFKPGCWFLSSGLTCKTMGMDCGNADDEDDPPCVIDVGDVCDVETAGGTQVQSCVQKISFFHVWSCIRDSLISLT